MSRLAVPARLRYCMLALVLINLVFVHITHAVESHWLWPLYGLALLSPVLVRAHRSVVYRLVWNCSALRTASCPSIASATNRIS